MLPFVLAGFLIAVVSCSDAFGFSERSTEVDFEKSKKACESRLSSVNLDSFVHIAD